MRRLGFLAVVLAGLAAAGTSAASTQVNVIMGTPGDDVIVATPEQDVIYALSGDDVITDVGDGDVVYGSSGNDTITTVPHTTVTGIRIEGDSGHDFVFGRADDADVDLGSGNDIAHLYGCGGRFVAGAGDDFYDNTGCTGDDDPAGATDVEMGSGHDDVLVDRLRSVSLGSGDDRLNSRFPGLVEAGPGDDVVDIDLGGDATIYLGSGHDFIRIAEAGNVTVYGGSGRDDIGGGHFGNNVFYGESGDDVFSIGDISVDNALDGGSGDDLARISFDFVSGTTCERIERVTDFEGNPREC